MSEAHAVHAEALTERMTWSQICERFPDQWVALVEMDLDGDDEVATARVAGWGATRAEPFARMRRAGLRYEEVGHFFTGRVRSHPVDFVR